MCSGERRNSPSDRAVGVDAPVWVKQGQLQIGHTDGCADVGSEVADLHRLGSSEVHVSGGCVGGCGSEKRNGDGELHFDVLFVVSS